MSTPLRFYTHPMSRGRMVRWMLEECQASYETVVLAYNSSMKSPDYLRLNPMGKVPALQHGEVVVTETPAILCYLADLHPQAQLAPAVGDPARGSYYRWLFFVA
ncbi:MAG: glutathione S-transferase, partial [Ramlibacter sp.]|nr:glutathione S-transferase [Ramlibacter sp.]